MLRILVGLIIALLVFCGALGLAVSHYRDHAMLYKEQRDSTRQELEQANETLTDMQRRQRENAALDAKYMKELADAKSENDALRADVTSGRRRLYLNAQCVPTARAQTDTASMDDAAAPRLTDAAQRDYLRLRERIDIATKQITGLQEYINKVCLGN
ncbi:lysis protein [Yersinia enterocolitica]